MKDELGAVLRIVRHLKGADYASAASSISRTNLSMLERGETRVLYETLAKISDSLDFDLVTLDALCLSLRDRTDPDEVIARAVRRLDEFKAAGGLELLNQQFEDGKLKRRPRSRPENASMLAAVADLKAKGMTRAEVARELGLAKTTVQRYWMKS
ncbi:helix-turn-helix protein [compost metagenome]